MEKTNGLDNLLKVASLLGIVVVAFSTYYYVFVHSKLVYNQLAHQLTQKQICQQAGDQYVKGLELKYPASTNKAFGILQNDSIIYSYNENLNTCLIYYTVSVPLIMYGTTSNDTTQTNKFLTHSFVDDTLRRSLVAEFYDYNQAAPARDSYGTVYIDKSCDGKTNCYTQTKDFREAVKKLMGEIYTHPYIVGYY